MRNDTKLHLGCGEVYFEGYVNIDYPMSEHSVQKKSLADEFADITKLKYRKNSIDEIRLHHVFEHFDRVTAAALAASWTSWLKEGGLLRVEVPDFDRTIRSAFSMFASRKRRGVGLRHIFGSQEASWAIHYHGWSERDFKELLSSLGYKIEKIKRTEWRNTYNIEIYAKMGENKISKRKASTESMNWLSQFLVDDSNSEKTMGKVWKKELENQIDISWAK